MLKGIRNVIFDLGGVVINIDFARTHNGLVRWIEEEEEEKKKWQRKDGAEAETVMDDVKVAAEAKVKAFFSKQGQLHLVDLYETGKIDTDAFLQGMGEHFFGGEEQKIEKQQMLKRRMEMIWNDLILDLPEERLHFIRSLREKYGIRTFLFSNTNDLHLQKVMAHAPSEDLYHGAFEKEFYSHRLGLRKPTVEAFQSVLQQAGNLAPEETLFIDDTIMHIHGARQAGLHAIHLDGTNVSSIFHLNSILNLE